MHKNERVAWNVLIRNQPRPQGFSLKKWVGSPPSLIPGDEVGMCFSEMRYHGRNHRIKKPSLKTMKTIFFFILVHFRFFLTCFVKKVSTPILEGVYGIFVHTYLLHSSNAFTKESSKIFTKCVPRKHTSSFKQKRIEMHSP